MRRSSLVQAIAVAALLVIVPGACTQSQAPARPGAVEERRIAPRDVNVAVEQWFDDHHVWLAPSVERTPRIMLLLPGTNGRPANARLIGAVAAQQGYRAIGLMYPNSIAVVQACAGDPDPACMGLMRDEIVQGNDVSLAVTVDRDNSIDGRLADLIRYLAARYPRESWLDFLAADGTPRWDRIAVGGLSQGGGHAAYIAKLRAVPRVAMFGAPADGYGGEPAPWMQLGATPADRYFGFRHLRDPFTSIQANWIALGLDAFGAAKDVTSNTVTFDDSHMLTTDLLPATGTYDHAHPSVFGDQVTPKRPNGTPVFDAAWRYLLGKP